MRFQLICGERRLRAVKEYTDIRTILPRVIEADDLEARGMCAAENLQRENLSAIETIEVIVDLIDAELNDDDEYRLMGNNSLNRVRKLLGKMDTLRRNEGRNYTSNDDIKHTSHKFMGRVENIFKNLLKSLKWRSFYENDLQILMDTSEMRKRSLNQLSLKAVSSLIILLLPA